MAPTTSTSRSPRPVRHGRERFFIEGEGVVGPPGDTDGEMVPRAHLESSTAPRAAAFAAPTFRFSRVGPRGAKLPDATLRKVAQAMTRGRQRDGNVPAGFTYLGQFIDHDLTFDKTSVAFGDQVSPADLLQGRSPSLDLDSLYGAGPDDPGSEKFYEADGRRLKMGRTQGLGGPPLQAQLSFPEDVTVAPDGAVTGPTARMDP